MGSLIILQESLGDDGGTYDRATIYQLISANSVAGVFDAVSKCFAFLDALTFYQADDVMLRLARNDFDIFVVAATTNQIAAASGNTALGSDFVYRVEILLVGAEQASVAFDQFLGEILASAQTMLAQNSQFALGTAGRHAVTSGLNIWAEAMTRAMLSSRPLARQSKNMSRRPQSKGRASMMVLLYLLSITGIATAGLTSRRSDRPTALGGMRCAAEDKM